jgi:hypothetical protein
MVRRSPGWKLKSGGGQWALAVLAALALAGAVRLQAQETDPGWPRDIPTAGGVITVYQPQLETLKANVLSGRAATSYLKNGSTGPVFGVFWFEGRLDVDRDSRVCMLSNVHITRVRFHEATPDQEQAYIAIVEAEIPKWQHPLSLDRVLASLEVAEQEQRSVEGLKNDPPKIIVSEVPGVLVVYDGEPKLRDIPGTKLQRVINTAFPVIFDPATKTYYLTNTRWWYSAADPMGPWQAGATPPTEVAAAIPKDAKEQADQDMAGSGESAPPQIVTAKEPTELICTRGKPDMRDIGSGDLLYVRNTDSNLFLDVRSQKYYVLLSGRWYTAASLQGPWAFVRPDTLPNSFNTIPPVSAKATVRTSIPGTEESKDALMDAQIPQTAAVKRGVADDVKVNYDGEPQFKAIEGTSLESAVNTGQQVLKVKDSYYLCQQGVWYFATGPNGPWTVSDRRPDGVDDIPASSPLYNVKYVYVYDSTPEVVYVGYTPGYTWAYPYYGTVVYGTGWYYPGWVGAYYYPWAWTWGWGAYYSPYYGWGYRAGFGWGFAWGFAWGAAWSHWGYGCGYWGGGGYYNGSIHIGNISIDRPGGGRGQGGKPSQLPANGGGRGQGNRPAQLPSNNMYNRGDNAKRNATPEQRAKAAQDMRNNPRVSQGMANNVYAGRDGNVYRQTGQGWQERGQGGSWNKANMPSTGTMDRGGAAGSRGASAGTMDRTGAGNLDRDAAARQRGTVQTQQFNSMRGSGMSRGGGGRRR